MNKARAWIIAAAAVVLGACSSTPSQPPPKAADLTGNWVLTTHSRMGAQDAQMTVRQTGSALAGTITAEAGTVDYLGTVNGATVEFGFTIEVHGNQLKLDYAGIVEGDTIQGKAVFGQFGDGTFTARRQ